MQKNHYDPHNDTKKITPKKFLFSTYRKNVDSVPAVMDCMQLIQDELVGTNLSNLQAFNQTYYIITKNVYSRIGTGYFQHDEIMSVVDIDFAKYYFDSLYAFVNNKTCPPSWEKLFHFCQKNNSYKIIYMALGVNAHVNNDLGISLANVISDPSIFTEDFLKVNMIIDESLDEVILALKEETKIIKTLQNETRVIYSFFLRKLIRNWRDNAWGNCIMLQKKERTIQEIEIKAGKIADKLCGITSLADIYKLPSLVV